MNTRLQYHVLIALFIFLVLILSSFLVLRIWFDFPITSLIIPALIVLGGTIIIYFYILSYVRHAKEKEDYARAVIEYAGDGIITIDEEGLIQSFNPRACDMFGYSPIEVLHKNIMTLMPQEYRHNHLKGLRRYLTTGEAHVIGKGSVEVHGLRKNLTSFPLELSVTELFLQNKRIFIGILRDISERKKVDTMKNEFISVVSHELRTPLTSIHGSISLLAAGVIGQLPANVIQLINIAKNNSERLIRLINDILDIEKIELGKLEFHEEELDINEVVNEAITQSSAYAERYSVFVVLENQMPGVKIKVDRGRLVQVLLNLISNAIRFSPVNGRVNLAISLQPNNKVRVEVKDEGLGIPEAFRPRIFEKFAQADTTLARKHEGTGLGLSISKAIIDKMGGSIGFESEEDRGTTFYFDLPRLIEEKIQPQNISEKKIYKKIPTIMICEPNKSVSQYFNDELTKLGYRVLLSHTATEVKQNLAHHEVDCLLMDLLLPDEDGLSLVKEIKNDPHTIQLPIVVLSIKHEKKAMNGSAVNVVDWIDTKIDTQRLQKAIDTVNQLVQTGTLKILHIEDDADLAVVVANILRQKAEIVNVSTLKDAKAELENQNFDLAVLDLLLPDGSGVELIPLLSQKHIPIIVFSAYELPKPYVNFVNRILTKSKTTNEELLTSVTSLIKKMNKETQ